MGILLQTSSGGGGGIVLIEKISASAADTMALSQ
jgi:hypothetical protein